MPLAQCEAWVDLLVGYAEQVTRTLGGRIPVADPGPAAVSAPAPPG
jgi:hypothetical protein